MVSRWTRTEFASTLARNVRMRLQREADARALMGAFEQDLASSFYLYAPPAEDFDLAARLLLERPTSGLRGADALHLAAAKQQSVPLYTLDKTLLRAAEAFGVPASDAGIGAP